MLASRVSRPRVQPVQKRIGSRQADYPPVLPASVERHATGSRRPLTLLVVMILAAGALVSRLVFWQVMQHGRLSAVETAQRHALLQQPALRGQITDARGSALASDVTLDQVYAVPKQMSDPAGTAAAVAPLLGRSALSLQRLFSEYSGYILLAPHVTADVSDRLKALRLPGIVLRPTLGRTYPQGSLAAQVVGFVNADGHGNYGLEQYYDRALSGKAGLNTVLHDTAGNEIRFSNGPQSSTHNGADLKLSLDRVVQSLLQSELQRAVKLHSADGGTAIVMDPSTGYLLGMASTPTYDPNRYGQVSDPSTFRNPAVEWSYEPGSTFKIITMAAGLESRAITPDSSLYDNGSFHIADATLHNWCDCGFGPETMTQVLQHSANVGAAWVAWHMSTGAFYSYVRRFGFDSPTDVDLADEQAGLLPLPGSRAWTIVSKYTTSYGQGIAVTPIQLVRAVAAVANGGLLMKPQVVREITYAGRVIDRRPVVQSRVISPQTARTLTAMLVNSAHGGEAEKALVNGYDIAAKTGTANVVNPRGGGYIPGDTIASIIGYAPAYHPRFVVLVILNHPRDTQWGSLAAAPVLHSLFQDLFFIYHIPPAHGASTR